MYWNTTPGRLLATASSRCSAWVRRATSSDRRRIHQAVPAASSSSAVPAVTISGSQRRQGKPGTTSTATQRRISRSRSAGGMSASARLISGTRAAVAADVAKWNCAGRSSTRATCRSTPLLSLWMRRLAYSLASTAASASPAATMSIAAWPDGASTMRMSA